MKTSRHHDVRFASEPATAVAVPEISRKPPSSDRKLTAALLMSLIVAAMIGWISLLGWGLFELGRRLFE